VKIIQSSLFGGDDVISMPRYFKPWDQGLSVLRTKLKKVDEIARLSPNDKKKLKEHMAAAGLAVDQPNGMPVTGRGRVLLAVFDPASVKIVAIFKAR
jgi:hypothetical protein